MILDENNQQRIELPDDIPAERANHVASMNRLSSGLRFLYQQVKSLEQAYPEKLSSECEFGSQFSGKLQVGVIYGRLPGLNDEERNVLECFFDWYAVSVCNFVRMIGWIRYPDKKSEKDLKQYVADVIPEIKVFRDKVGAHREASTSQGNLAESAYSVMPQVNWSNDRFYASGLKVFIKRGMEEKGRDSGKMKRWSLTEQHEKLIRRYPLLKKP